ncbi:hypothetical protein SeMB42_g01777 [Synchytrium endobioticum]|uniref:C-CAP/cofactor C-like domain-containing protein n=1 Tax=Synchytrium endobioticum TaxID=286115 RepID=A0A507DBF6_9FUNG|nr:hypothetical protein SeLEV6574_g02210 [Synchytrium endobioticum]TPX51916.1 hypothetical protein SeMB42_g01777 [Synchytrium endobioticum]
MSSSASNDFYRLFQSEKDGIQLQLDELTSLPADQIALKCDQVLARINGLQEKTNAATIYLPSYDQRQLALQTKELMHVLATNRARLVPKPKFSFKSKRATKNTTNVPSAVVSDTSNSMPHTPHLANVSYQPSPNSLSIANHSHAYMKPSYQQETHQDAYIQHLDSCIVDLRSVTNLAAVYISDLRNCIVTLPPVNGSVWADQCQSMVLFAACRQFRMHQTSKISVYLHVVSHPIIEHCTAVAFGRYAFNDASCLRDAQLEPAVNLYTLVDDFDWLKQQQSPNWAVMGDAKQAQAQIILDAINIGADATKENVDTLVSRWCLDIAE